MRNRLLLLTLGGWGFLTAAGIAQQQLALPDAPPPPLKPRGIVVPYSEEQLRAALKPRIGKLPDTRLSKGLTPPDAARRVLESRVGVTARRRGWQPTSFHWAASETWHHPLYFEDVMLERHGHSAHPAVQPLVSGTRYFLTYPTLAYKLALDAPRKQLSTLGHYRPGSPAPHVFQLSRFQWDAAVAEAGAWVGLVLLVP